MTRKGPERHVTIKSEGDEAFALVAKEVADEWAKIEKLCVVIALPAHGVTVVLEGKAQTDSRLRIEEDRTIRRLVLNTSDIATRWRLERTVKAAVEDFVRKVPFPKQRVFE